MIHKCRGSYLIVLGLVALLGSALAPSPAEAGCFCLSAWYQTGPHWGMGTTCAEAQADSENTALSHAHCTVCDYFFETLTSCVDYQGMKRVDLTLHYRCLGCFDGPFEPRDPEPVSTSPELEQVLGPADLQMTPVAARPGDGCQNGTV